MIPPVSSATPYVPVEDLTLVADQFFSNWKRSYIDGDFVSPLLQLIKHSRLKDELNSHQKREWVESMHQEVVKKAYSDDFQKFALEAGPHLVDLFLHISQRNSIYLRNSLIFYSLIKIKDDFTLDVDWFVEVVSQQTENGIEMIEAIKDSKFRYFRDQPVDRLCENAIEKAKWEQSKKEFYRKIFPFVLIQIEEADRSGVDFRERYVAQDPCCCKIL